MHDPALLQDLISDECVIEDTSPAPAGARHEGGRASLARWSELADNADLDLAPWTLRWGEGEDDWVRGVNLIRVRDGRIVEARGYMKT